MRLILCCQKLTIQIADLLRASDERSGLQDTVTRLRRDLENERIEASRRLSEAQAELQQSSCGKIDFGCTFAHFPVLTSQFLCRTAV